MKRPRLKTLLLIPVFLFAAFYLFGVIMVQTDNREVAPLTEVPSGSLESIAIFGASGTAGDGILKAALADPQSNSRIGTIHVITRRFTPRIEAGDRDISEDSSMHWTREKARAEIKLFALAEGTRLDVIAWRPDYIGISK